MKAYKVELLIIDHDEVGKEQIVEILENTKYPNWCISPDVKNVEEREIGEWTDNHPLNLRSKHEEEYLRLFSENNPDLNRSERIHDLECALREIEIWAKNPELFETDRDNLDRIRNRASLALESKNI